MARISETYTTLDVEFDLYAVKNNIGNKAPSHAVRAAEDLARYLLEPLREHFAFRIVSWYRSEALERCFCKPSFFKWCAENRAPLDANSWSKYIREKQHVLGQAVSIVAEDIGAIAEHVIDTMEFDIIEKRDGYLHLSFAKGSNRKMVL